MPAGAPDGSPTITGPVEYVDQNLDFENVIFDGSSSDDLIRVYGGHVNFTHVTFRGVGTGVSGHTVEVKNGGSVTISHCRWEGSPAEDSIQFADHRDSLIEFSEFADTPGEDHLDVKPSGTSDVVTAADNQFLTPTPGGGAVTINSSDAPVHLLRNTIADMVHFTTGTGVIEDNTITDTLRLYLAHDIRVETNTITTIKHGEFGTDRVPVNIAYLGNTVDVFEFNGGSCSAGGNDGSASFSSCTTVPFEEDPMAFNATFHASQLTSAQGELVNMSLHSGTDPTTGNEVTSQAQRVAVTWGAPSGGAMSASESVSVDAGSTVASVGFYDAGGVFQGGGAGGMVSETFSNAGTANVNVTVTES